MNEALSYRIIGFLRDKDVGGKVFPVQEVKSSLFMPWRRIWEWKYCSAYSYPRQ